MRSNGGKMPRESRSLIWGIILILLGLIFLGKNLDWFDFSWGDYWPSVMIIGGLFFWFGWITKRQEFGLLMPGTILLVYGIMFQYSAINGWYYMDVLWPGFLLGPGLGFLFMYLLGNREKGLLIPAFILIILAALFWMEHDVYRYFWPAILIALGIYLLLKNRQQEEVKKDTITDSEQPPKV
jgi:hypothetical protein